MKGLQKPFITDNGLKFPQVFQPIRIALTGGTNAPSVYDIIAVLGIEETVTRLKNAIELNFGKRGTFNMITIWHNNRCSKSREAKAILEESGLEFEVFEYLKNDFSKEELLKVMAQLKITDINDMLRKKETEYKELDIANKSQK